MYLQKFKTEPDVDFQIKQVTHFCNTVKLNHLWSEGFQRIVVTTYDLQSADLQSTDVHIPRPVVDSYNLRITFTIRQNEHNKIKGFAASKGSRKQAAEKQLTTLKYEYEIYM